MTPLLFALESELPLQPPLLRELPAEAGRLESRRFPDGETFVRVDSEVAGRHCLILANLYHPDDKFLPLIFLSETLRELGAASVGLVAPYLCYMRQDRRFAPGEAVTSRIFARWLSTGVDWLVTVDPHLHRYRSLDEIYTIPTASVASAPLLAAWLQQRPGDLLLVGPDAESEQWVGDIAARTGQPFVVGQKQRRGDRDVSVTLPDLSAYREHTAVVIDDVIASGHTILEAVRGLRQAGLKTIDCAAVHALFPAQTAQAMREEGVRQLITSNAIPHASNGIDLSSILVQPIRDALAAA